MARPTTEQYIKDFYSLSKQSFIVIYSEHLYSKLTQSALIVKEFAVNGKPTPVSRIRATLLTSSDKAKYFIAFTEEVMKAKGLI